MPVYSQLTRDSFTPDQGLIISPHPHCGNLYFALRGSFHSWKLLPTIGSYVVQMLQGTLETEKVEKWAWDRVGSDGAHGKLKPKEDLADIPGYSKLIQNGSGWLILNHPAIPYPLIFHNRRNKNLILISKKSDQGNANYWHFSGHGNYPKIKAAARWSRPSSLPVDVFYQSANETPKSMRILIQVIRLRSPQPK